MARTYQVDKITVMFLDEQIGMGVNEVKTWTGAPVACYDTVSFVSEEDYGASYLPSRRGLISLGRRFRSNSTLSLRKIIAVGQVSLGG
jgi:hypothetical protein